MGNMTNWPTIVNDLTDTGMTRAELAAAVKAGVSTLADLATGSSGEPRHALGVRLLKLHARRVPKSRVPIHK